MEKIKNDCFNILKLIGSSQFEQEYYSIIRIEKAIKKVLNNIKNDNIKNLDIDIKSLSRNFVDDTGDYSNAILKELQNLDKDIVKEKSVWGK